MLIKLAKQDLRTLIMICMNFRERSSLVIRRTRSARSMRSDLKALRLAMLLKTRVIMKPISISEIITRVPSKQFILSLTYPAGPKATFLIPISVTKTKVKTVFTLIKYR